MAPTTPSICVGRGVYIKITHRPERNPKLSPTATIQYYDKDLKKMIKAHVYVDNLINIVHMVSAGQVALLDHKRVPNRKHWRVPLPCADKAFVCVDKYFKDDDTANPQYKSYFKAPKLVKIYADGSLTVSLPLSGLEAYVEAFTSTLEWPCANCEDPFEELPTL